MLRSDWPNRDALAPLKNNVNGEKKGRTLKKTNSRGWPSNSLRPLMRQVKNHRRVRSGCMAGTDAWLICVARSKVAGSTTPPESFPSSLPISPHHNHGRPIRSECASRPAFDSATGIVKTKMGTRAAPPRYDSVTQTRRALASISAYQSYLFRPYAKGRYRAIVDFAFRSLCLRLL